MTVITISAKSYNGFYIIEKQKDTIVLGDNFYLDLRFTQTGYFPNLLPNNQITIGFNNAPEYLVFMNDVISCSFGDIGTGGANGISINDSTYRFVFTSPPLTGWIYFINGVTPQDSVFVLSSSPVMGILHSFNPSKEKEGVIYYDMLGRLATPKEGDFIRYTPFAAIVY